MSRLNEARAAFERLTMPDQLSLLVDYFGGRICRRSDAFHDALYPVSEAFDAAYPTIDAAAEPEIEYESYVPGSCHPDNPCKPKGYWA